MSSGLVCARVDWWKHGVFLGKDYRQLLWYFLVDVNVEGRGCVPGKENRFNA